MSMTMSDPWDISRIRAHVGAQLPLMKTLGITIETAEPGRARVRLDAGEGLRRPGGAVAGPVLFAMADLASYLLTLVLFRQDAAVTASLAIQYLRPAMTVPLIAEAVPLREGRSLQSYDVRIWAESEGPERLVAQANATWAKAGWSAGPT
jgi:uncharacterized protein (TIGR00369 family)